MNVQNVLVVVSRWYGGILLGPDRFKHINNCARNILVEYNYVHSVVSFCHLRWRHFYVNVCKLSPLDEARRNVKLFQMSSSDCFGALVRSVCTDRVPLWKLPMLVMCNHEVCNRRAWQQLRTVVQNIIMKLKEGEEVDKLVSVKKTGCFCCLFCLHVLQHYCVGRLSLGITVPTRHFKMWMP